MGATLLRQTKRSALAFLLAAAVALVAGCTAARTSSTTQAGADARARTPQSAQSSAPSRPTVTLQAATIIRIVDGDTALMRLKSGPTEKVRFIGVDAPEYTTQHEPFGAEAADYTKRHLRSGGTVYLETDTDLRDRYDRLPAYVWLSKPADYDTDGRPTFAQAEERLFNARLVRDGYARIMAVPPNVRYQDYFLQLQRRAQDAELGLWDARLVTKSAANTPKVPPGRYIGNRNSMKFHRATCPWVARMSPLNKVPIKTREAAISVGYRPCKTCNP